MNRATVAALAGDFEALRDIDADDVIARTPDEGTLNGIDPYLRGDPGRAGPAGRRRADLVEGHLTFAMRRQPGASGLGGGRPQRPDDKESR